MRFFVPWFLAFFLLPVSASAADCYLSVAYGTGEYRDSLTRKLEDKLLQSSYVDGSYAFESRSRPYQIGAGCPVTSWLDAEVGYLQGYQTVVVTAAALCVDVFGERVCSPPALIHRTATLEGWELALIGKLRLDDQWSITTRIGALSGTARVRVTIPEFSGSVGLSGEKRGVIPVLGLGMRYQANPKLSLAIEHKLFDDKSGITQLVARWSL